jgi:Ser/Thr protein kinase RdoA (MazF antagonist)
MSRFLKCPAKIDPLHAIASLPPQFRAADVQTLLSDQYGLDGRVKLLVSERDQNFHVTTAAGSHFVLKIANAAEDPITTDFLIRGLLHMEEGGCPIAVPRVVRTLDGGVATTMSDGDIVHVVRLVSYVQGRTLADVTPDVVLARKLGSCLAEIDIGLRSFEHAGDHQASLWDMQRAAELRGLTQHVEDPGLLSVINRCFDDFEQNALPRLTSLRTQVIHNDFHPENVLVAESDRQTIAGVIDFGDMVRAPLIIDVAIAAAYLRPENDDPLALAIPFVAGYDAITRLDSAELELLYDLVRTRLATTLTIMYWRKSARTEDDEYRQATLQSECNAERFLQDVNSVTRREFYDRVRQACRR